MVLVGPGAFYEPFIGFYPRSAELGLDHPSPSLCHGQTSIAHVLGEIRHGLRGLAPFVAIRLEGVASGTLSLTTSYLSP